MLMLLVCLCTYTVATAQLTQAKPKLFEGYPTAFTISESTLQNIFSINNANELTIDFGNGLLFPCKLVKNESRYGNMQTVIIRSTAFDNALLQVTRISNRDQSVVYSGRIINERAADGFEIRKSASGAYQLQKFETDKILEGCFL